MTKENPFDYGGPVTGNEFTGRQLELDAVVNRMQNHIGVVVTAPRRYGKSSLINQACLNLAATSPEPAIINVNLLMAENLVAVSDALVSSLYSVPGGSWRRLKHIVPGFLGRIRVVPRVTFDPASGNPSFEFAPELTLPDAERVFSDVYGILDEIGTKRPAVLVLDEFQAVTDLDAHLPRLLKALADEHGKVSLVLLGSKEHLMETLVLTKSAPLYKMLHHFVLAPIPKDEWVPFLLRRATSGGTPFHDESVAEYLVDVAAPVAFDIQKLAYESFNQGSRTIDVAAVDRAVHVLIRHEAANYSKTFEQLSGGQRRVLKTLAKEIGVTTGSAQFAAAAELADSTSVRKALKAMEKLELVVVRDGEYSIDDPFFAGWLR